MSFQDAMRSDVSVFTNPDEFGVSVVYSGDGKTYSVVVEEVQDQDTGRFIWVASIPAADIPNPVPGETLTSSRRTYRVVAVAPSDEVGAFINVRVEP